MRCLCQWTGGGPGTGSDWAGGGDWEVRSERTKWGRGLVGHSFYMECGECQELCRSGTL